MAPVQSIRVTVFCLSISPTSLALPSPRSQAHCSGGPAPPRTGYFSPGSNPAPGPEAQAADGLEVLGPPPASGEVQCSLRRPPDPRIAPPARRLSGRRPGGRQTRRHLSPPQSHHRWAGMGHAEPGRSPDHAPPMGVHSPPPAGLAPPVPRWTQGGPWASDMLPDGRLRARQSPVWMKLRSHLSDGTPSGRWTGRECVCVRAKSLQSCPTLCHPMDHSWPGSSVREISKARMLEWVAMPSSRGSAQPRGQTCVSYASRVGRRVLYC